MIKPSPASLSPHAPALFLMSGLGLALVIALGLALWAMKGALVFTELVDLALAWCM